MSDLTGRFDGGQEVSAGPDERDYKIFRALLLPLKFYFSEDLDDAYDFIKKGAVLVN